MKNMKKSSTWRFFLVTFASFVVAVTVVSAIFGYFIYKNEKQHLENNLMLLEEVYVNYLVPTLQNSDYKSLEKQIEGIVGFPHISRVEITTEDGQFFSAGSPENRELQRFAHNLVFVGEETARNLGTLHLFVSGEQIRADVINSVRLIFLLQLSLGLALSGIIALFFHLMTGRHLLAFSVFLENDDPRRNGKLFSLNRKKARNDELQMLEEHFNRMRGRIGQYVEDIQELKDLLQYVIRHDPNGILVLDKELRCVFVSEKCLFDNHIHEKNIIGQPIREVAPQLPGHWDLVFTGTLFGGVYSSEDEVITYPDGRKDILRWSCRPWYKPDGSINGVIVYSEVITERKDMERSLYLEKELFKTTLLSVGDGVISTDRKGNVLLMNTLAEKMTGWSSEEAAGKPIETVFPVRIDDPDSGRENSVLKVLVTGERSEMKKPGILISKDGREIPIEDSAAAVKDVHGDTTGVVIVFRDCTENRERQRKIEFLSYHDQLTGVFNRRFFDEELKRLDVPRNLPLSLVMIDVNGLKLFNDAFGHKAGDMLLKRVAEVLQREMRGDDIIARIGGDEFIILLPCTGYEFVWPMMERIVDSMGNEYVEDLPVSISWGCGTKISEGESAEKIFEIAEDQMYRNKISHKSSYHHRSIEMILETLYSKAPVEREHSPSVSILSELIGAEMHLDKSEISELRTAGAIHDIGKIAVSNAVLEKKGKLSSSDWIELKKHPEVGYNILSAVNEYSNLAQIVLAHHEWYDGNGYPKGLKGDEIPLQSRIIAVAEAYDSMVSGMMFSAPKTLQQAVEELQNNAGTQFDPAVVSVFVDKVLAEESIEDELCV
ncbi:MAG: diguanylate cyclase [Proteiniphilum sp.]|nr:diguanylate cyclase [Proteiniphilum sp.]